MARNRVYIIMDTREMYVKRDYAKSLFREVRRFLGHDEYVQKPIDSR